MKKFKVRHSDGTTQIVDATNEEMARQFAMTNKWGNASDNKTWSSTSWRGTGLSVDEVKEDAMG